MQLEDVHICIVFSLCFVIAKSNDISAHCHTSGSLEVGWERLEFILQVLKQLGILLVKLTSPEVNLNVFCESLTLLKQNITNTIAVKE